MEKKSSLSSSAGLTRGATSYPIVHKDLMQNILFDDAYNVVGVIDWEYAHSAPFEIFAAATNMYARFDSKTLHAVSEGDDARRYVEDIKDLEKDIQGPRKLSETFGSVLGDLGCCMTCFEEGSAAPFEKVLDRFENMD